MIHRFFRRGPSHDCWRARRDDFAPEIVVDRFPARTQSRFFLQQSIRVTTTATLWGLCAFGLIGWCSGSSAIGDEPAVKADEAKAEQKDVKKASDKPKDDAQPAVAKEAAEVPNLEAVAVPLLAIFGAAAVDEVVDVVAVDGALVAENPNAEDVAGQNDAMVQQFSQQLRPVLHSELGFVRLICSDLNLDQRKKVKDAADVALKVAAKTLVNQQNQQPVRPAPRGKKSTEPRAIIRDAIAQAAKDTFTEEQLARYTAAATKRIEKRKQTAILSVVARLDNHLYFTPEQREKITESISEKWQDDWEKWTQMAQVYGDQYFPMVPENLVVQHLNPEQKSVFSGIHRIDFNWWWGGGVQGQNPDDDGWWGKDITNDAAAKPAKGGIQIFGNGLLELFQ